MVGTVLMFLNEEKEASGSRGMQAAGRAANTELEFPLPPPAPRHFTASCRKS